MTASGFRLQAPDVAGLYDLVFLTEVRSGSDFRSTSLGQIAVGVALLQDDVEADTALPPNSDTDGMAEEAAAMGAEEGPQIETGTLHGDWRLVSIQPDRTVTLMRTQFSHAIGAPMASGGLVVDASPGWGFGPNGGFGEMTVESIKEGELLVTIVVETGTFVADMTPAELGWSGDIEMADGTDRTYILARPHDLATANINAYPNGINHQLSAVDERGETISGPVQWSMQSTDMEAADTFQSTGSDAYDTSRAPGTYLVTAQSGDLTGQANFTFGRQERRANFIVMRPEGEGSGLAIAADFFCSEGENCNMEMRDVPVSFILPVGWGAERPRGSYNLQPFFNMSTQTASGPFFATMNKRQRMASTGPCYDLVSGTFCHDATDDPALLAEIEIIKGSLSYQPGRRSFIGDDYDTLFRKLTGTDP